MQHTEITKGRCSEENAVKANNGHDTKGSGCDRGETQGGGGLDYGVMSERRIRLACKLTYI